MDFVKIKIRGSNGTDIWFSIRRTMRMSRIMQAYCDRKGVTIFDFLFSFDGHIISPESTPDTLGLKNDDIIDVYPLNKDIFYY